MVYCKWLCEYIFCSLQLELLSSINVFAPQLIAPAIIKILSHESCFIYMLNQLGTWMMVAKGHDKVIQSLCYCTIVT